MVIFSTCNITFFTGCQIDKTLQFEHNTPLISYVGEDEFNFSTNSGMILHFFLCNSTRVIRKIELRRMKNYEVVGT